MTFTRQDAITFLLGLGAALGITVAEILVGIGDQSFEEVDWGTAGVLGNLVIGLLTATGRYLATRIPDLLAMRK